MFKSIKYPEYTCYVCGKKIPKHGGSMYFPDLKDAPAVCSVCVLRSLTAVHKFVCMEDLRSCEWSERVLEGER